MVPACGRLLAGIVLAVAVHAAGAHGAVWQAEHRLAEFAREATIDRTPSVISRVAAMTLRSGIDRTVSDMLEQPVAAGFILRGGAIEKNKSDIETTFPIPPFLNETMAVPEESPQEIEQTPLVVRSPGISAGLDKIAIGLAGVSSGELVDALRGFAQEEDRTLRIHYRASSKWPEVFMHYSRDGGKTWTVRRGHRQVAGGR